MSTPHIPLSAIVSSSLGLGPMPWSKVNACWHLVAEAARIGQDRARAELSHAEAGLRARIEAVAGRRVGRAVEKVVEPRIAEIRGLHAEAAFLSHQINALDERHYVGPHGESLVHTEAHEKHREWSATIDREFAAGAVHHRRGDPGAKRRVARLVGLDLPLLTFVMLKFLNTNFLTFWQTAGGWLKVGTAVLFGLLGTIGVALGMKQLGRRHRAYRAPDGSWDTAAGRGLLRAELGLALVIVLGVSGAMAWRFVLDGKGGDQVLTAVMALLFGVVTAAVAYLAYTAEFADGSLLTEAVDALAPQLQRTHLEREALCARLTIVMAQTSRLVAGLHRSAVEIRVTAERTVRESSHERAIRYARSIHQQNGSSGDLPEPAVDFSALDHALAQAVPVPEVAGPATDIPEVPPATSSAAVAA